MKTKEYNATTKQTTIRDMTPEEIAALEAQATEQPAPTPTPEEEIAALKTQLTALETILLGGETNG